MHTRYAMESPPAPERYMEPIERETRPQPPVAVIPGESELASRFWNRLRLFAFRRLDDAAAAEDVAQETLRRVIEAGRAGRIENPAALPGFVFQTARHICLQYHRSRGREAKALARLSNPHERQGGPEPLSELLSAERCAQVRSAIERLGTDDRTLLRWLYFEQLEPVEVARRLGITAGALRVRRHRAIGRLADQLPATGL